MLALVPFLGSAFGFPCRVFLFDMTCGVGLLIAFPICDVIGLKASAEMVARANRALVFISMVFLYCFAIMARLSPELRLSRQYI